MSENQREGITPCQMRSCTTKDSEESDRQTYLAPTSTRARFSDDSSSATVMAAVPVPPLCGELDARTVLSRELDAQRTTEFLSVRMYFPLSFSRS